MACHTPGPRLSDSCGGVRSQVRKQEQRLRGGGVSPEAQTRPAAVPELLAQMRPAAVLGLAGGPQGLGRGQRPSQNSWLGRGQQPSWDLRGAPRGSDEASSHPGMCRLPGGWAEPPGEEGPPVGSRGQGRQWPLPQDVQGGCSAQSRAWGPHQGGQGGCQWEPGPGVPESSLS